MLTNHFYNEAIRKTVVGFGTLFNNIEVQRKDPQTNDVLDVQKVPIGYGPRDKFTARIEDNPDPTPGAPYEYMRLPRMYFEMTGINYDASRKVSPIQKYRTIIADNGNEVRVQYVPVPYNISFELGVLAKSQDDGLQIVEQILPYFQPNFNITINFIPDMNEKKDVAIVMNDVNLEDSWDGEYANRRSIIWTFQFTAKSYVYGPFNQSAIIRKAIIFETVGDLQENKRNAKFSYTPKALEDKNDDGVIDTLDDALLTADDDFGFNGEIDLL
jgi:hypothetical protein